jgi:hypothetical protein
MLLLPPSSPDLWILRDAKSALRLIARKDYHNAGACAAAAGPSVAAAARKFAGIDTVHAAKETAISHKTLTTESGAFTVPYLAAGTYTATVGAPDSK